MDRRRVRTGDSKTMARNIFAKTVLSIGLLPFCTAPLFGQAVFGVATSQPPAADIGATELTGEIALTVLSGRTVAAPLAIEYSALITNKAAAEIQVIGTLGLVDIGPAPKLSSDRHAIVINVPEGGQAGSQIHVRGVRVDLVGNGPSPVTATVASATTGGNSIAIGQQTGPVTGQITGPFTVELGDPLAFVKGLATTPETHFSIQEGYAGAFTDAVGVYGQTVPTQIRITPFPEVPAGVKLTFGPTATSAETGASLRTLSGVPETIPNEDGSNSVIYTFKSAAGSSATVETFQIHVSMEVESTAGTGTITFQAAILPIGIAVPDSDFPSTAIPRYLEREVPDETELISGLVELDFPFQLSKSGVYTGLAITNPLDFRVNVELTAYDEAGLPVMGTGIKNPVELTMPRQGQIAKLATELFGPGFNASTPGTIRAFGKTPVLVGFYLSGEDNGPRLDGAVAGVVPLRSWIWPTVFHEAPTPFNTYEFFNPGKTAAHVELKLFDSSGHLVAEGSQSIPASGTAVRNLEDIFAGSDIASLTGGYVKGSSDLPLVATQTFGNARESNVLPGSVSTQKRTFYLAHFASGGGYETEVNILNMDRSIPAAISLTAIGEDGAAFPVAGNPARISIASGVQWVSTVAGLFPGLGAALSTGYIKMDVDPYYSGPFLTVPPLAGSIRFSAAGGYGSAALPLWITPSSEFIFSHVAQAKGYFTGVAMMNPNPDPAKYTLEVHREDGSLVGSQAGTLGPGEKFSKLVFQLVPASAGQIGGYIRVISNLRVVGFSLFGTDDGLSLSAIPGQDVSNTQ